MHIELAWKVYASYLDNEPIACLSFGNLHKGPSNLISWDHKLITLRPNIDARPQNLNWKSMSAFSFKSLSFIVEPVHMMQTPASDS